MAERQNNSSGGSNSSKKNESRFSQSPLNSEKKKRSKKADDSTNNGPIPKAMKYKPKTPPPAKENAKSPEEETESEGTSRENRPKVTVISFGSRKSTRRSSKAPPPVPPLDPESFQLTIETIMTGAKPLVLTVTKSKTVANIKSLIRSKIKAKNFGIFVNNKELAPEDSTLESNGIISDTKVRLHVKAQAGTSDNEDIKSMVRLTKSMNDLRNILHALPSTSKESKDRVKNVTYTKEVVEPEKKAEEDLRSREKMAKLREKFAQRNGKTVEKKKTKKKSRRDGGIAGQYALPAKTSQQNAATSSDPTTNSAEESSDREKIKSSASTGSVISIFELSLDLRQGPVTNKELLLYFDLQETEDRVKFLANELFEPPSNQTKLQEIRNEFKTLRCAHCRGRLPLILREMPCRCLKVYCQAHRSPFKHCCAVDLKKVDRIKLEKDVPKSNPVSRKNSDEELQPPKSSSKKLM